MRKIDEQEHFDFVKNHRDYFELIFKYIENYTKKYVNAEGSIKKVAKALEKSDSLTLEELSDSFINLLSLTSFGAPIDFTFAGVKLSRIRYRTPSIILDATLIHQSVTGLYETRIDLSKLGEE